MPAIDRADIISMDPATSPLGTNTFKGEELITTIQQRVGAVAPEFFNEGLEAQYFSTANPKGWQTGRIKMTVEFIPAPAAAPATPAR